jgi:hypothetical protein
VQQDAMIKRPWSLHPQLFKTSLIHLWFGHYVPCILCACLKHPSLNLFWSHRPLITMSSRNYGTIRIFVTNRPFNIAIQFFGGNKMYPREFGEI